MTHLRIPPALTLDLGEDVELAFQWIPAGSFQMGSRGERLHEEPLHQVILTRPFYLATFPVTQDQFARWKPDHENRFPNQPRHPAEQLTWHQANQYCQWLNRLFGDLLPTGHQAGLPSEAQWEYACRAGSDSEYYSGDGEAALAEAGWYQGNSKAQTQPVGLLRGNDFGLCDMHGNVWEWCADAWDRDSYHKRISRIFDPIVEGDSHADRVFRGGSWTGGPWDCRSACRESWGPGYRFLDRGFRVGLFPGHCTC